MIDNLDEHCYKSNSSCMKIINMHNFAKGIHSSIRNTYHDFFCNEFNDSYNDDYAGITYSIIQGR